MPAPRKPNRAKALAGTDRPSRRVSTPLVLRLSEVPPPPDGLSSGAVAEWVALAPVAIWLGTLASSDLRGFRLLCETLATEAKASLDVIAVGYSIATADGGLKSNPAVRVLEVARTQAARLLTDFGLTPKGRAGLDTTPLRSPGGSPAPDTDKPAGDTADVIEGAAFARLRLLRGKGLAHG